MRRFPSAWLRAGSRPPRQGTAPSTLLRTGSAASDSWLYRRSSLPATSLTSDEQTPAKCDIARSAKGKQILRISSTKIKNRAKNRDVMPEVMDLFAGVGGFTLGASLGGFATKLAIDNDSDLSHSFQINFPNTTCLSADISRADPRNLFEKAGISRRETFGIVGGPPCQGFSAIGQKRRGDPRNLLVSHFFRFVKVLKPAFFIMENVPGILTVPFASELELLMNSLSPTYDLVGPMSLDAVDFGAPTLRKRVIVLGYQSAYVTPFSEKEIENLKVASRTSTFQAIHDLPSPLSVAADKLGICWTKYLRAPEPSSKGDYARKARALPPKGLSSAWIRKLHQNGFVSSLIPTSHRAEVVERFAQVDPGKRDDVSGCPRLAWDKPSPTLRAGTGSDHGSHQAIRPIHPAEDRVITVREAARLQGFPDWFQFHPTKWHSFRMIGNSVCPLLAASLLAFLRTKLADYRSTSSKLG